MARLARYGAIVLVLSAGMAAGQVVENGQISQYEFRYGTPVDATISDLLSSPSTYAQRAVRTKGTLDMGMALRKSYILKDTFGKAISIVPVPEVDDAFQLEARTWMSREVQITGVFFEQRPNSNDPNAPSTNLGQESDLFRVQFWKYLGPPDPKEVRLKADEVTLESLVSKAGKLDGQTVRVVGKFRGRNLFGDLPARSERDSSDWVIKDDVYSVWITGKRPKGSGWELDLNLKRDTNKWIEVVGRPETIGNVTYVRALSVVLGGPPHPLAQAAPPPPPPPRPKVPPVVVFSLPLDGERDVPATGLFKVQFSKDMDEDSFKGRVVFRYAGPRLPGDREFVGVKMSYDLGRRALIVDPGDVLRPGRMVELRLLDGIVDVEGLPLVPRPGREATANTAEMLRFETAASSALLPGS